MAVCLLALAGCGANAPIADIMKQKGITAQSVSGMEVELRYLSDSKGANYMFTDISGNADLLKTVLQSIAASKPAQKPKETQFTPELRSDCEIAFIDGNGNTASFYYMEQNNLLIYPDRKKGKNGDTLTYLYFSPDAKLGGLISAQRQLSKLKQDNAVKPFRNMEELKSSIDADELAEQGTELDFEFFDGSTPDNTGTACRIYTSAECAAVPQDSYLIATYGKSKSGQQEKLSIQGMETNTNYTKVIVSEPDSALDSVDTGDSLPDSFAITVKKDAIDPGKWIVFVDSDNNVLDVILPEDIASSPAAAGQQGTSPSPAASPTASTGGTAIPTASPAATPTPDDSGDTD